MPVKKELMKLIPKLYRRSYEDNGLYFFVRGQKQLLPSLTIDLAIKNYFREVGIEFDEWDLDCARVTYFRMVHEFYDNQKCNETAKAI